MQLQLDDSRYYKTVPELIVDRRQCLHCVTRYGWCPRCIPSQWKLALKWRNCLCPIWEKGERHNGEGKLFGVDGHQHQKEFDVPQITRKPEILVRSLL
jgi:hypothetical protein